ncbi:GNAT family N-acetyltransferase [Paenibacillus sp. WLX2291]|uniref:GNAT family N-acetyltransferase n=1 Tax=Paenibacillus sp. WLX2291 TaxID=3296934 RepID=UPI0039843D4D
MQTTITFDTIQEQHLPEVLDIYNHYVQHTTISFHTELQTLEQMREQILQVPERYRSYAILEQNNEAEEQSGQKLLGYILITRHKNKQAYDTTAEITVYLKPDQTGKGLGSQSLTFIEQAAVDSGFHTLVATVCTENENSIRLFERRGYEKCAHFREVGRKFDRWLDIASYQKIIGKQEE